MSNTDILRSIEERRAEAYRLLEQVFGMAWTLDAGRTDIRPHATDALNALTRMKYAIQGLERNAAECVVAERRA